MITKSKKEILKALKIAGYRLTKHRLAIVNFIAERNDHPSVKKVFNEVKQKRSGISLATVYNTLNLLVHLHLLKEIEFDEKENRYDTNIAPHLNLICIICGSITDSEYELPVAADVIQQKNGFLVKEYRIEYRGICQGCHKSGQRL